MMELEKLGDRIKELRLQNYITQEELSSRCNFDTTYIILLERGKRNPSYLSLLKLSKGMGVSITEIVSEL